MPKITRIRSIRLDEEEEEACKDFCRKKGVSFAELARIGIGMVLGDERSALAQYRRGFDEGLEKARELAFRQVAVDRMVEEARGRDMTDEEWEQLGKLAVYAFAVPEEADDHDSAGNPARPDRLRFLNKLVGVAERFEGRRERDMQETSEIMQSDPDAGINTEPASMSAGNVSQPRSEAL